MYTNCGVFKLGNLFLLGGWPLFSWNKKITVLQTTTALWYHSWTCICVKGWFHCNTQSYLLHLLQRSRYEHSRTDNMARGMNQCERAYRFLEISRPCSYNSHSLWYWHIPFLHMDCHLIAGCWDQLSWLLSNPLLPVHQCWSCKLLGRV